MCRFLALPSAQLAPAAIRSHASRTGATQAQASRGRAPEPSRLPLTEVGA